MKENIHVKENYGGVKRVYYGVSELCQNSNILESFPKLFDNQQKKQKPIKRVVEIGSARGGLPLILKSIISYDFDIISYDIVYQEIRDQYSEFIKEKNINFIVADCFDEKHEKEIADFIKQEGVTLVLCDGGDKIREFNTFSKYLKPGDLIMCHDYGENTEQYINDIDSKNIWRLEWLSSDAERIQEACETYNLCRYMQEDFLTSVWGIRTKNE